MISFLLGSGFSYDEGIPSVGIINNRLVNTKAGDIYLGSDQSACFLKKGEKDPNAWFPDNVRDRNFFEKFIEFYVNKVAKGSNSFNYEDFVDYFNLPYVTNGELSDDLKNYLNEFRHHYTLKDDVFNDNTNLLFRFNNIFTQLVAELLVVPKYNEDISSFGHITYNTFVNFLGDCLDQNHVVNVHTLNHDLFFEFLGRKQSRLTSYFTDGYSEIGSPYYADLSTKINGIEKSFKVRVPRFTNVYEGNLRLYKLHGSIDTYSFNIGSHLNDPTRIKMPYGADSVVKEIVKGENGYRYVSGLQGGFPDFLSGTTYKQLFYSDNYYKQLHTSFCANLKSSHILFVIGYGFSDKGINKMLEENYLLDGKMLILIDPNPKEDLIQNGSYNIRVVRNKINSLNFIQWKELFRTGAHTQTPSISKNDNLF